MERSASPWLSPTCVRVQKVSRESSARRRPFFCPDVPCYYGEYRVYTLGYECECLPGFEGATCRLSKYHSLFSQSQCRFRAAISERIIQKVFFADIPSKFTIGGSKGGARDAPPPWGSKFFHFHAVFGNKIEK